MQISPIPPKSSAMDEFLTHMVANPGTYNFKKHLEELEKAPEFHPRVIKLHTRPSIITPIVSRDVHQNPEEDSID